MTGPQTAVWLLACYGMTFLLCSAKVTAWIRRPLTSRSDLLAGLLGCYFCMGFWVALGTAYWALREPLWAVFHGFAGATSSYAIDAAIRRLEAIETVGDFDAIRRLEETMDGLDQHTATD